MGKSLRIVAGGTGISAAPPFTPGQFLIVSQTSPPIAFGGRMQQLADAGLSVIAPDVSGAVNSFVLGSGSRVPAVGGTRSIAIGTNVLAAGNIADQNLLIGSNINAGAVNGNASDVIAIGHDIVLNSAGVTVIGGSISIGANVTQSGGDNAESVAIGSGARVAGGVNVAVGALADAAGQSVSVGRGAGNLTASQSVSIGDNSGAQSNGVTVGANASVSGVGGVAVGFGALAGTRCVAVGREASGAAFAFAIAIGNGARVFEANACNIGGEEDGNGADMRVFRWGPNTLTGYPGLSVILPSAGSGANQAAPNTTFRGGLSTGNSATGGRIIFQSSVPAASSSTYQAVVPRLRIAPGGAVGVPTIEFVNQVSTPGVAAGTLLNAPAVGNPTVWAEVLYNGVLKFIPMW